MSGQTPILEALQQHIQRARGPLHVPGHQMGAVLPQEFGLWLGQAAKLDLTELPGLDNLMAPSECILESERLAALHYGSDRCFYSVNGSSAGIMAAFVTLLQPGDRILLLNPFHLSAWYGLVHSGADAVCMSYAYSGEGRQLLPAVDAVREALHDIPNLTAVYLTSPTYQGDTADVKAIAQAAHDFDLPLIVDEAHGAHFGLTTQFPAHSVESGADIVIQSTHKMLPALTQTAWVQIQGKRINHTQFAASLNSLQSSSPSYLLMASLDSVQAWLRTKGTAAAERTTGLLQKHGLLEMHAGERIYRDPLKHWIPSGQEQSRTLQNLLAKRGLFIEYADGTGLLSVFGFGLRESILAEYVRVVEQWRQSQPFAESAAGQTSPSGIKDLNSLAAASPRHFTVRPKDAWMAPKDSLSLQESAGRVAAAPLAPYPPGLPVVYPGQKLTVELVDILQRWLQAGQKVQGVSIDGEIEVMA